MDLVFGPKVDADFALNGGWSAFEFNGPKIMSGGITNVCRISNQNTQDGKNLKHGGFVASRRRRVQPLVIQLSEVSMNEIEEFESEEEDDARSI